MFRQPLWPIRRLNSRALGTMRAVGIPVMDIHELAAGKLAALLARHASRDLFDAHQLLTTRQFAVDRLRLAFVVYGGLNRKDWRSVTAADVGFSPKELQNELIPVLRTSEPEDRSALVARLVDEVRDKLALVLPFTDRERAFLDRLLDEGTIEPKGANTRTFSGCTGSCGGGRKVWELLLFRCARTVSERRVFESFGVIA